MTIAFDIDGTLIHQAGPLEGTPRYDILDLYRWFESHGWHMVIWSGGGLDYARHHANKLGIGSACIVQKGEGGVDIAVDDMPVALGKVNIIVPNDTTWTGKVA